MNRFLLLFIVPVCLFAKEKQPALPKEELVETSHTLKIGGVPLNYKATAGTLVVKGSDDKSASIFYIAYTKEGETKRPITFCFNGGPGSSSVWLNIGVFGPRRIAVTPPGYPKQPATLIDNQETLLSQTDLVFIDPVSTAFSTAEDPKRFYGFEADAASIAEFIRLYTSKNSRWDSPKFLAGESYGTTRAVGVASHLFEKERMDLAGIVLVSAVLNFETLNPESDLCYSVYLPTYTATAWYYKKLPQALQSQPLNQVLEKAKSFAANEYVVALMQGDLLPLAKQEEIAAKLSELTGVDKNYILRSELRVPPLRFVKEILREKDLTVGRMDTRFTSFSTDRCQSEMAFDPSLGGIVCGFSSAIQSYIRNDLNYKNDSPYNTLNFLQPWDYGCSHGSFNLIETMRDLLVQNRNLKVFVAAGYYDLATPYFASDYTFSHLLIDPSARQRVSYGYYNGGHMFYLDEGALKAFRNDLSGYYKLAIDQKD